MRLYIRNSLGGAELPGTGSRLAFPFAFGGSSMLMTSILLFFLRFFRAKRERKEIVS